MAGLSLGGFIGIVVFILILNIAGVVAYYRFIKEKAFASEVVSSELAPKLRYGLLGLLFLSWIFSIACTVVCTFVKVQRTDTLLASAEDEGYLGLHGIEDAIRGCRSGDIEDDRVRMAFAFAILNILLTSVAMIGCPLVIFNVIKDANTANTIWEIMGFLVLASTWFCLFTFYVQQAPFCHGGIVDCSLGGAGVAQVFNSMFLIGICVLFFVLPLPASEEEGGKNENGNNGDKDTNKAEKKRSKKRRKKKRTKKKRIRMNEDGYLDSVDVDEVASQ